MATDWQKKYDAHFNSEFSEWISSIQSVLAKDDGRSKTNKISEVSNTFELLWNPCIG
jgi:hypothetical protein